MFVMNESENESVNTIFNIQYPITIFGMMYISGVSKSSKKGFFYKSSYLRFEFFITMQN